MTIITTTLPEDQYTFLIISRLVLLRMRNVWIKVVEKIETHILYSIKFYLMIVPFMRQRGKIL
jgi:hypothetical protein